MSSEPDLWIALGHLEPQHRAALLLSTLDGYTQEESHLEPQHRAALLLSTLDGYTHEESQLKPLFSDGAGVTKADAMRRIPSPPGTGDRGLPGATRLGGLVRSSTTRWCSGEHEPVVS
jgi:hypothetical protein